MERNTEQISEIILAREGSNAVFSFLVPSFMLRIFGGCAQRRPQNNHVGGFCAHETAVRVFSLKVCVRAAFQEAAPSRLESCI